MTRVFVILTGCIALCNSASFQLPHGHDLQVLVRSEFDAVDRDKNGILSNDELAAVHEDINHDGNLTLAEYASYWNTTPDIIRPIFNVLDKDGDGIVHGSQLQHYGLDLDPKGNGYITWHDYEHFMTGFLECVYGHGEHGHGHNCDH